MLKYCPVCGNNLEEGFKFCPNCGKKLIGEIAFCPECGKKMILSEKRIAPTPEKRETVKAKKRKSRVTFPKFTRHIPRKTAIVIIAIICLAVVVSAAVIVLSPFGTNGGQSAGRSFTVTVENTFGSDAVGYLKVGSLKYGGTFTVMFGIPQTINVEEDTLFSGILGSNYSITLYATINDITEEATAIAVTESANFLVSKSTIGEVQVECTDYQ
ncbi:MAG: zinc ribbon domain-containing protein [Thermoplasmatales archaeon]|nr:MAG: zinc ribbon domain-containing protein [Thermoplasmatales archaeon]